MLAHEVNAKFSYRQKADRHDVGATCTICKHGFWRGQAIFFTLHNKPAHKRLCFYLYWAGIVIYYDATAHDIIELAGVSRRTAYRIYSLAHKMRAHV